MKLGRFLLLMCLLVITMLETGSAEEDAMSHYLRKHSYTPVPTNQSDIVPGMLLAVNWKNGTTTFEDLNKDAGALTLMPPSTQALNPADKVTTTKVNVLAALKSLVGFDVGLGFQGDGTFTFSGIGFKVQRLNTNDVRALIDDKNGATYKAALALFNAGNTDVFFVTQVQSAKTAEITASKANSIAVGQGDIGTLPSCTVVLPAESEPNTPKTVSEQQQKQIEDKKAADTVSTKAGANAAANSGGNNGQNAAADSGGNKNSNSPSSSRFTLCHAEGNRVRIANPLEVPVAVVVWRLIYNQQTGITIRTGDFAVPVDDPGKCRRHLERQDGCYNPPRN